MARICLVRPLLSPQFSGYPLNLLILAASLRNRGHEVVIQDFDFLKELDHTWSTGERFAQRAADCILSGAPNYIDVQQLRPRARSGARA
jgi:hypothetical protein